MIVTVTLNTGIDRTICIPDFHWDGTIRAEETALGMGGKAIDVSWVLGEMNVENLALGFAAGITGKQMESMLHERNVKTNFTWVDGESRTNTILINKKTETQSTVTTNGLVVTSTHLGQFVATYQLSLNQASCVVIGGSLPENVPIKTYKSLIEMAHKAGIPVIFDASGDALTAGLSANPTLIKPNKDELQQYSGRTISTQEDVIHAAIEMHKKHHCIVVATMGADGAIAITEEKQYIIEPLRVDVQSTAGTGDAIVAGLAYALSEKKPIIEGLRTGFAAAAAVMLTLGTADCRLADIQNFRNKITIREINL